EKREGFSCVTGLASRTPPAPLPTIGSLPQQVVRTVSSFLHPAISQRIQEGLTSFINEHRKVVVLFVHFENLDYDDDLDVGEKLQDYFSKVIEIVHSYDGYLNKVDMGDKGSKYIVLFGAPIAHEDDVDRALYCALDLQEIPGAPVRIGINTGFVFCGQVGSPVRQEYTVMGDAVNLSARLMQAAQPGQLLMSEAVYAESEGFTWVNLPSIQVKGKTEEVVIRHLKGLKDKSTFKLQEPEYALPMVGREHELATAREKIERVLRGQGQIVGITAEAGMGKSRLGAEIIRLAMAYGLTPYGGECVSHGTNASYLVWQNLLRGFFELDPAWPLEDQAAHLQFQLKAINPNFVQRIPLLGLPLNQTIPDNELTQAMDAGLRKSSLEAMLVECIRHRAGAGPLLLVLEDCHWIDPLSNDLLETIGRNIIDVPALLLVIYRPSETERIQPKGRRFGHFTEISLLDFTEAEAARLIELKLRQLFDAAGTVPADLTARITERAQGNPFYIDEMINLIHDRGIDPADAQALEGIELPDSLHSLIISRIDQLHEGPKTTLKIASVIGRLFKADWLWGVYPQLGDPSQVKTQLEQLHQLEITPLDKPEPELEYLFKHILTREVAYESLAVATRTMLHGEIGAFIERTYPDGLDQLLNILAHHYGASDNTEKQREYFYKAGVAAQNAYANEAAIEYYQHLLHLFREEERIDVMLRLGQVWQITGRWSESENIFRKALK
ncbi:MAG: AAA family ATPase, partial [Anaerolineales bacterium]